VSPMIVSVFSTHVDDAQVVPLQVAARSAATKVAIHFDVDMIDAGHPQWTVGLRSRLGGCT
jgi:hypothetical protein